MKSSYIGSSDNFSQYLKALAAGLLLLALLGELLLRFVIIPSDREATIISQVYLGEEVDIVIGDSHIADGFRDTGEFLNLAIGGMTAGAANEILQEYFRHRQPGRIVIGVGPQYLSETRIARESASFDEYFFPHKIPFLYLAILEPGLNRKLSLLPKHLGWQSDAGLAWRSKARQAWKDANAQQRKTIANSSLISQRPADDYRLQIEIYSEMIRKLLKKNALVCLVRPPVSPDYELLAGSDPKFQGALQAFDELARQYNIRLVAPTADQLGFTVEHYYNPDHLTENGAKAYAKTVLRLCYG